MGRVLGTAAIFVAAFFFLLLALGNHLQLLEARSLVASGAVAEGTVTAIGAPRRSTAYRYSYTYRAGGKDYSRADKSIAYGERENYQQGTRVKVWHDRSRPEAATTAAELADLEFVGNRLFLPGVGLAFLAWGLARIFRRRPPPTGAP